MDWDILDDVQRRQLIWFGHVSRMEEGWLPRKVFERAMCECRLRGRVILGWKDYTREVMMTMDLTANEYLDTSLMETRREAASENLQKVKKYETFFENYIMFNTVCLLSSTEVLYTHLIQNYTCNNGGFSEINNASEIESNFKI